MSADGIIQVGFIDKTLNFFSQITHMSYMACCQLQTGSFAGPTKAWACLVTCDPCQSHKFKGYRRVFIYVGAGHLIHYIHTL